MQRRVIWCARRAHLAVETVDFVHAVALVVAAREVHAVRVQHLVREQREDHLYAERAAVDKVTCGGDATRGHMRAAARHPSDVCDMQQMLVATGAVLHVAVSLAW